MTLILFYLLILFNLFEFSNFPLQLECNVEELRLKLKDELERSKTVVKEKVYLEKESRDKDFKVKELEDTVEEMQKKLDDLSNINETLKVKIFFLLLF